MDELINYNGYEEFKQAVNRVLNRTVEDFVLTGYLLREMKAGRWKRLLFCPTGALHSPTSAMQGESIPGICHAVVISSTL